MNERRKNRRIGLESKIIIKCLGDDIWPQEVAIEIVDVSKTGIGFKCKNSLELGAVYEAYLTIWTKEVIHVLIEVIRIDKAEDSFLYGGIFVGMAEMDAARIAIYDTFNSEAEEA